MTWGRRVWTAVGALAACCALTYGLVALGYRSPDDPYVSLVGVRVTDGRIIVKVPVCPEGRVMSVRVKDYPDDETLWKATGPLTPEALRGEVTLWRPADFREASGGERPAALPKTMEVWVTATGGGGGSGVLFKPADVAAADLPAGAYWTRDGPRTAAQVDDQRLCNR